MRTSTTPRFTPLVSLFLLGAAPAFGQQPAPPPPAGTTAPTPPPPPTPPTPPTPPSGTTAPAETAPAEEQPTLAEGKGGLRIHIITTQQTYEALVYDVFEVESQRMVGTGRGVIESRGEDPQLWELDPGIYKIVRAGEPLATRVDFATVQVEPGRVTDFVIVVDPETKSFRGSGVLTTELPSGVEVAGIKLALNAGGNLLLNQKANPIGTTSGTTMQLGLFGNFGLVLDRENHFLNISAELQLNLTDPVTGSVAPTSDRFEASALYAYNINNPYFGPYVRGGFRTRVFPGYLYLESPTAAGVVTINHLNGTQEIVPFGNEANPDNLRVKIAESFAPFILQEEVGGNLKAVDLNLILFKLVVATRLGFGFRQGFTNGLLVVDGDDEGPAVTLNEVDDYNTLGPVLGASASVTFARWLFGSAQFGMLVPLTDRDQAGDNFGSRLLIDFSGTAGFKVPILTNLLAASFDYTFRLERDGYLTEETQFEQTLMARAVVTLF